MVQTRGLQIRTRGRAGPPFPRESPSTRRRAGPGTRARRAEQRGKEQPAVIFRRGRHPNPPQGGPNSKRGPIPQGDRTDGIPRWQGAGRRVPGGGAGHGAERGVRGVCSKAGGGRGDSGRGGGDSGVAKGLCACLEGEEKEAGLALVPPLRVVVPSVTGNKNKKIILYSSGATHTHT